MQIFLPKSVGNLLNYRKLFIKLLQTGYFLFSIFPLAQLRLDRVENWDWTLGKTFFFSNHESCGLVQKSFILFYFTLRASAEQCIGILFVLARKVLHRISCFRIHILACLVSMVFFALGIFSSLKIKQKICLFSDVLLCCAMNADNPCFHPSKWIAKNNLVWRQVHDKK